MIISLPSDMTIHSKAVISFVRRILCTPRLCHRLRKHCLPHSVWSSSPLSSFARIRMRMKSHSIAGNDKGHLEAVASSLAKRKSYRFMYYYSFDVRTRRPRIRSEIVDDDKDTHTHIAPAPNTDSTIGAWEEKATNREKNVDSICRVHIYMCVFYDVYCNSDSNPSEAYARSLTRSQSIIVLVIRFSLGYEIILSFSIKLHLLVDGLMGGWDMRVESGWLHSYSYVCSSHACVLRRTYGVCVCVSVPRWDLNNFCGCLCSTATVNGTPRPISPPKRLRSCGGVKFQVESHTYIRLMLEVEQPLPPHLMHVCSAFSFANLSCARVVGCVERKI